MLPIMIVIENYNKEGGEIIKIVISYSVIRHPGKPVSL
jgi:hypothetical protein